MFTSLLCISLLAFGVGGKVTQSGFGETAWHRSQLPSNLSPPKIYKGSISAMIVDSIPPMTNFKIPPRNKLKSGRTEEKCWKCPQNRTVIAPRKRDYVSMETPPVKSCYRGTYKSGGRAKSVVVYGPRPGTIVGEGSHMVMLRVSPDQVCHFSYNVIVRKCTPLPQRSGLLYSCSAKNIWGSECIFSCEYGYQLIGFRKSHCNRNLKWNHPLPFCKGPEKSDCTVPAGPENGYLSCWSPEEVSSRAKGMLPHGATCQYHCHKGYQIPPSHKTLTVTKCSKGHWDTSQDPICIAVEDSFNTVLKSKVSKAKKDIRRQHLDTCFPGICKNGGRCYVSLGEARCVCSPGYTGLTCSTEI